MGRESALVDFSGCRGSLALVMLLLGAAAESSIAAETCIKPMARIVSVEGRIEIRRARESHWQPAALNSGVCLGDSVRVAEHGRAALALDDDQLIRLDQRSAITFAAEPAQDTLLELCRGVLHFITRFPKRVRVITPFLNAAVEGTEFTVTQGDAGDKLTVVEGVVSVLNTPERSRPQACEMPRSDTQSGGGQTRLRAGEEAFVIPGKAPTAALRARPVDAVQWALYYPPVIEYRIDSGRSGWESYWTQSLNAYREGKLDNALAAALQAGDAPDDSRYFAWRAGLLLRVGRVEQAESDIERALNLGGSDADARALQAIVAVVRNERGEALALARKAVAARADSPAAHIALSYALQADFKIDDARSSARRATEVDSRNAIAWARLAELEMSSGNLEAALAAARRAAQAQPQLARAQVILGFAHLTRSELASARAAFDSAIGRDSADPLPRVGRGLALIRAGELVAGRKEIEIAVTLDPANALLRSYLGKAYYEESRDDLASGQFDLAKALDPLDPTPWLYEATLLQAQHLPTSAVLSLEQAQALNDNRAVFRSRFLLDKDLSARGVSIGNSYRQLNLEALAISDAASALSLDPASYSAHRLLSDVYQTRDRHEFARGSELLQAQLLQPGNSAPLQPRLAFGNLALMPGAATGAASLDDLTSLFQRDRFRIVASGQTGSLGTDSYEAIVSGLKGPLSFSGGHYQYRTNGFRDNNDLRHDISTAFVQYDVNPSLALQAEYRNRKTRSGDLLLNFDPDVFSALNRNSIDHRALRFGASAALSERSRMIFSAIDAVRDARAVIPDPTFLNLDFDSKDDANQYEVAYAYGGPKMRLFAGFRAQRIATRIRTVIDFSPLFGESCPVFDPPLDPCDSTISARKREQTPYLYATAAPVRGIALTLGVAHYKTGVGSFRWRRWSPKFGLQLQAASNTVIRIAAMESIKPFLAVNETIEPTQVAGINQFFDDGNLAKSRRLAIAIDHRLDARWFAGVSASGRKVQTPGFDGNFNLARFDYAREQLHEAYLAWLPTRSTAVKFGLLYEAFEKKEADAFGDEAVNVKTLMLPVSAHHAFSTHVSGSISITGVRHELVRLPDATARAGRDDFVIVDAAMALRLPQRRGIVRLEARNLLKEKFFFYDANFFSPEPRNPRFVPTRVIMLSIAATF